MEWLLTIAPDGRKVYFETSNIRSIQLIQPLNIMDNSEPCYMVVITYDDGHKEQTVLPHYSWEACNSFNKESDNEN